MNIFIFTYQQRRKRVSEEIPAKSKIEAVRNFMQGVNFKNPISNLNVNPKYGTKQPKQLFK